MKIDAGDSELDYIDIFIMVLSIYVLGAIIVETFFSLPPEMSRLLNHIDTSVCFIFFVEFCYQFYRSKEKLKFMKWGWIDLISCIPMVDSFRYGRILRLIRLIRLVKAFKTISNFTNHVFKKKTKGMFTTVLVFAVLLVIFSAIAILIVETDPNSNIKTAEDALWWSYVTITTVGYGDKFPVTTEGRVIAAFLMTVGVGLFGTFTAYISSIFLKDHEEKESE